MRIASPRVRRVEAALAAGALLLVAPGALADDGPEDESVSPSAAAALPPDAAVRLMTIPKGLKIELWAEEPLVKNGVAFTIDNRGRAYVAETFRRDAGAWDSRAMIEHLAPKGASGEEIDRLETEIVDADLASRSIDDRTAFIEKYFKDLDAMRAHGERLRRVVDRDGDGRADVVTTVAGGFNGLLDGITAGVLARGDEIWWANIPSLWWFLDRDDDGVADERRELHRGFGIRFAYGGHDLHGLQMGPDGRLYFSVGDRAANVRLPGPGRRSVAIPDAGAVFRCNPDGSELELFATGLRNPQDLQFDEHGNLFTGDNNSDGGDKARWVYLVEGGDSGWRIGYQYIRRQAGQEMDRGPWNWEKLWHPAWSEQAAYIVPPIEIVSSGPAGVAYYPGTGLGAEHAGRFLLVDFRGQPSLSGLWSFTLRERGAGFALRGAEQWLWGVLATDVNFGPDGALYILDWVLGWEKPGRGRIWRVSPTGGLTAPEAAATRTLLGEGMARRQDGELFRLLDHADMRVRLEAQLELAARGSAGWLREAAVKGTRRLPRLHGLWGLGQLMRRTRWENLSRPDLGPELARLLDDRDPEVRAQAAKVLGEGLVREAVEPLIAKLSDENARVRFFAALSLGKLRAGRALPAVVELLRANADQDPFLRHAGVMALAGIGKIDALAALAGDPSPAVRVAAVVALRRLQRPEVARFLADADVRVAREAARAIADGPVEGAAAQLAAADLGGARGADGPLLWRVINANFRAGDREAARRIAAIAAAQGAPADARAEALLALAAWSTPSGRDRVTGVWRPVPAGARPATDAAAALDPVIASVLRASPAPVQTAAAQAAGFLGTPGAASALAALAVERKAPAEVRAAAVDALGRLAPTDLDATLRRAESDPESRVRLAALRTRVGREPAAAAKILTTALRSGTLPEKQFAMRTLASVPGADAETLLGQWLDQLTARKLPLSVAVELLEAASRRESPALQGKVAAFDRTRPRNELGRFIESETGGNPRRGRMLFRDRPELGCVRCHKIDGNGGDVGPDLIDLGRRFSRRQILEAIVLPNKTFAPGYESVILTLKDGRVEAGVVRKETSAEIHLVTPEQQAVVVKRSQIKARERGVSSMPDGLAEIMSRRDLRDIVEYLATPTNQQGNFLRPPRRP